VTGASGGEKEIAKSVKHYTDLEVWRRSHQLFLDLLNDLDPLPQKRSVAILTDQIR
jgi:hypothetical protein